METPAKSRKDVILLPTTAFVKSFAGGYTLFKLSEMTGAKDERAVSSILPVLESKILPRPESEVVVDMESTMNAITNTRLRIVATALAYLNLDEIVVINAPKIAATVVGIRLVKNIPAIHII